MLIGDEIHKEQVKVDLSYVKQARSQFEALDLINAILSENKMVI
jgi:hypothetical protein